MDVGGAGRVSFSVIHDGGTRRHPLRPLQAAGLSWWHTQPLA